MIQVLLLLHLHQVCAILHECKMILILMLMCFPVNVDIVFTTQPSDINLALNVVTQFMCSAFVSGVDVNLIIGWIDTQTGVAPIADDGFTFYSENLEESDLLYITTVLAYSGSAVPVSYSLACTASVESVTKTIPFSLTVSMEAGTHNQHNIEF